MAKIKFKMAKIDPAFKKRIEETALEKMNNGTIKKFDREMISVRRFTKAIARYDPLWEALKKADFLPEENK